MTTAVQATVGGHAKIHRTSFAVLGMLSAAHLVNDMMQSLLLSLYPLLKGQLVLSFAELGCISLTYQITASLLQPFVGMYTDGRPTPVAAPVGMGLTLVGVLTLAFAGSYPTVLVAAALIGTGSSVFHPESSRIARLASGERPGLAQSIFQIGGNAGSAIGPLLAALIIVPNGRQSVGWVALLTLASAGLMLRVAVWYGRNTTNAVPRSFPTRSHATASHLPARSVAFSIAILIVLMFSKYVYLASLSSYYTFYLMERFGVTTQVAQLYLFIFLFASAIGTIFGGLASDRLGRKRVIWISILGVAPFTLLLPHVSLAGTCVLTILIGLVLASAFSAIVVHAQELVPNRVGMISGLFFGLAFGLGGIGAAVLGVLADHHGIQSVYRVSAYLPLLGIVTALLPETEAQR